MQGVIARRIDITALPSTLTTSKDEVKLIVFLSDEIFAKNIPILVTVDPISSAILRIELADSRKVEDWKTIGSVWNKMATLQHIWSLMKVEVCARPKKRLWIIRQPDT
jgi:hypothetical protein